MLLKTSADKALLPNGKEKVMKHNFVAKHGHKYNTAKVFVDRKAQAKRGYRKHKSLPDESCRGRNATQGGVAGAPEVVSRNGL